MSGLGGVGWRTSLFCVCHDTGGGRKTPTTTFPFPNISLQPSFFFSTPSQRCASSVSSIGKFAAAKSDFRLERHTSELERRLQDNGSPPSPHAGNAGIRSTVWLSSFLFRGRLLFCPGPAVLRLWAPPVGTSAPASPVVCFRSTCRLRTILSTPNLSFDSPFFLGHQRINSQASQRQTPMPTPLQLASSPEIRPGRVATTNYYEFLRTFFHSIRQFNCI